MITLAQVEANPKVATYLAKADEYMKAIGYTEHGKRHATITAKISREILTKLNFSPRQADLAAIAAYLHDVGNLINRTDHGQTSAIIAGNLLTELGMDYEEVTDIMGAIGNHEEELGDPISPIAAAIIIADKADVHRSRVRTPSMIKFDIHDRVNYAVEKSVVNIDPENKKITYVIKIDTSISQVMEYFEIFLSRMIIAKRSANFLGCDFELLINDVKLL
jgi:metal-dependent HD superfamily phosphatase/phosphodiesterase